MWKKASESLKDFTSLFVANLAPRSALRNPDIEAAVIKATSHNDSHIDYQSAQRIFAWIRVSSHYTRPVLSAISYRMERTRSWTVALKGLMLLHGVFSCKVPAVQKIGRLPFDLSQFRDRNPNLHHHEAFVRAYYAYLDKKSSFMFNHFQERKESERIRKGSIKDSNQTKEQKQKQSSMMQDLLRLESLQEMLDVLLKIKPQQEKMMNVLVLEAMDCVIIEIFDIYIRICNGIAGVLVRIYSAAKTEAAMALSILQKAAVQGQELARYVEFCRDFGVIKASECPKIVHIRQEDIRALEKVIKRDSCQLKTEEVGPKEEDKSTILVAKNDDENNKKMEADEETDSTSDSEATSSDDSDEERGAGIISPFSPTDSFTEDPSLIDNEKTESNVPPVQG